jgi:hypothetical protein
MMRVLHDQGHSHIAIAATVRSEARRRGLKIPTQIEETLRKQEFAETGKATLARILPGGDAIQFVGKVLGLDVQVNFFKRAKYERSKISEAFLGRLAKESWAELRIREDVDAQSGIQGEMTAFVPLVRLREVGVRIGDKVLVFVESHTMPTGQGIWLIETLKRASMGS